MPVVRLCNVAMLGVTSLPSLALMVDSMVVNNPAAIAQSTDIISIRINPFLHLSQSMPRGTEAMP